ncbi:unnamed protein product, partial [Cochlearia groenlandica]
MSTISENNQVEVSSEDEGFKDAWYEAVLLENPTNSDPKKLLIRYNTLFIENGLSLLTEYTEHRFIRPAPPKDQNITIEEGLVVDAYLNDGWWTGFVIKKLEEEEEDTFLVYFNHPPDLIQFHRENLRSHYDWIDSKWVKRKNKELSKSLFSSGTMVEVFCMNDKLEAFWVPALIVKEIVEDEDKKSYIVKCCNNNNKSVSCKADEMKPNVIVEECNVRPKPPPFFESITLLDRVDAFRGAGWRQGVVKAVLYEKRYIVTFVETKEEDVFKHDDIRLSKEWRDGVWHQPAPPHGSVNQMGDNVMNGAATIPFITPRVRLRLHEKTSHENNLQPTRNQNGLGVDSNVEK